MTPGKEAAASPGGSSELGGTTSDRSLSCRPPRAIRLLACLESLSPRCDLVVLHHGNRPLISAGSIAVALPLPTSILGVAW